MTPTDDEWDGSPPASETESESGVHRYDRDTREPCSQVVVSAVAATLDCSPLDLEPLYHRVDPEALDGLLDRSLGTAVREEPSVRFRFAGCHVTVSPVAVRVATGVGGE